MESTWIWYRIFKALHLAGIVLWLGPMLGGYAFILRAHEFRETPVQLWFWRIFRRLIVWKHIGLLVVLAGAIGMTLVDWNQLVPAHEVEGRRVFSWWHIKAGLFLLGILPLEIADVYVTNGLIRRGLTETTLLGGLVSPTLTRGLELHSRLSRVTAFSLAITVPLFFYLGLFKPYFVSWFR